MGRFGVFSGDVGTGNIGVCGQGFCRKKREGGEGLMERIGDRDGRGG